MHISAIFIQTLSKLLRIDLTVPGPPVVASLTITVRIRRSRINLLRLGGRLSGGGPAAEEAADGVADGRSYCYTALWESVHDRLLLGHQDFDGDVESEGEGRKALTQRY